MTHEFDLMGKVLVVTLRGKLNSTNAPNVEQEILERLDQGTRHMIIDLDKVDYMSSAGLRVMLVAEKRLRTAAGQLVVCGIGAAVREVLDISGFLSILKTAENRQSALLDLGVQDRPATI